MSGLIDTLFDYLYYAIFLIGLYYVISYALGVDSVLSVVASNSMSHGYTMDKSHTNMIGRSSFPFNEGLNGGDVIIKYGRGEYKIGDVVSYEHKDKPYNVLHRIVNENQDGTFITRGDARRYSDDRNVSLGQIRYKPVLKIPKVGLILLVPFCVKWDNCDLDHCINTGDCYNNKRWNK